MTYLRDTDLLVQGSVNTFGGGGGLTEAQVSVIALSAVTTHEGKSNPHPQYLTSASASSAYAPINHAHVAASITDFSEAVDDRVGALLVAGTGINLNYNDGANTLTIATSGAGGYTDEQAQDAVGTILTDSADIDFTYNDAGNTISAVLTSSGVTASTYGGATIVPVFTVDGKGRITSVVPTTVSIVAANVANFDEAVDDRVGALLVDSAEIDFAYNDSANTLSATLLTTGVSAGTYGTATIVPAFTVDSKGRITSVVRTSIQLAVANVTGFDEAVDDRVGALLVDSTEIDFAYNDSANTLSATLLTTGVSAGTYGTATIVPAFTVDTKGRITSVIRTSIQLVAANITDFSEAVDDRVGALVVAGTGMNITYDDAANTLTFATSGAGGSYTDEQAQDAVGTILTDSADIDFTYNDAGNTISAVLTSSGVSAGTYGDASNYPIIVVDGKGRITSVTRQAAPGGGAGPLDALTDVSVTAATSGAYLTLVSNEWVARQNPLMYISIVSTTVEISNRVLTTVPGWNLTLPASGMYFFEWQIFGFFASVPDVQFLFEKTDTSAVGRYGSPISLFVNTPYVSVNTCASFTIAASTTYTFQLAGYIKTAGSTCNCAMRWAQQTSNAAGRTALFPGCTMKVYR